MKLGSKLVCALADQLGTLLFLLDRLFESRPPFYGSSPCAAENGSCFHPGNRDSQPETSERKSHSTAVILIYKTKEPLLPLRDAARQFLDLLLVRTTRFGPLRLRSGLLAGGALQFLPFLRVFNLGGICHL